jgi:endonuclease/exonuclease/phosphatase family metal-dependent hydrolase
MASAARVGGPLVRACLALLALVLPAYAQTPPVQAQARPVHAQAARANRLRVVSYNIGMGVVVKLRSEQGLRELFEDEPALSGAHVLSLQEVCLNERRQLGLYLAVMQAMHRVQYHYADYASDKLGEKCDKGQAIVSAYPIVAAGTLRLTTVGAARSALWVDLALSGPGYERVRVYDLHLSNREKSNYVPLLRRAQQADKVLEHALAFMRRHPRAPVIVTGDFNTLGTLSEPAAREFVVQRFQRYFQTSQPRFSSTFLVPYQLDWIFYAGVTLVWSGSVSVFYSDHLPVVADFRL